MLIMDLSYTRSNGAASIYSLYQQGALNYQTNNSKCEYITIAKRVTQRKKAMKYCFWTNHTKQQDMEFSINSLV